MKNGPAVKIQDELIVAPSKNVAKQLTQIPNITALQSRA